MIFMDTTRIRNDFPIFENNPELVYLDSAATSQRPIQVLNAMREYFSSYNANVHRGVYKISEEATEKYEKTRRKVQDLISAADEKEVIYTKGTTESINLVMRGYGGRLIKRGDKIVTTILEHHSNFVPWQQLAKKKNAKFEVIGIDEEGKLKEDELKSKLKDAKILAISHASNMLGTINDIDEICRTARDEGAISVVDAAQSTPHMKINVRRMQCDFLAFSGHKMMGPTGIGVLYGRLELLEGMEPFLFGGEMISEVRIEESTWNRLPYRFEAGTQPIAEAIGLGAAIDYLKRIGMENVLGHEKRLTGYALGRMEEIKNLRTYGPRNAGSRAGIVAFNLDGIHAHDVATVMDEFGIAIRSGHHCAMPLHERLGIPASARASFYIYNSKGDIDRFIDTLKKAKKIFKVK